MLNRYCEAIVLTPGSLVLTLAFLLFNSVQNNHEYMEYSMLQEFSDTTRNPVCVPLDLSYELSGSEYQGVLFTAEVLADDGVVLISNFGHALLFDSSGCQIRSKSLADKRFTKLAVVPKGKEFFLLSQDNMVYHYNHLGNVIDVIDIPVDMSEEVVHFTANETGYLSLATSNGRILQLHYDDHSISAYGSIGDVTLLGMSYSQGSYYVVADPYYVYRVDLDPFSVVWIADVSEIANNSNEIDISYLVNEDNRYSRIGGFMMLNSTPLITDDFIVISSMTGNIYLLNDEGYVVRYYYTGDYIFSEFIYVVDEEYFVYLDSGVIVKYMPSGEIIGIHSTETGGNRAISSGTDRLVYAEAHSSTTSITVLTLTGDVVGEEEVVGRLRSNVRQQSSGEVVFVVSDDSGDLWFVKLNMD